MKKYAEKESKQKKIKQKNDWNGMKKIIKH